VLLDRKMFAEAVEAQRKAIACNPHLASSYINLGTALRKQNKLKEARDAFEKGIALYEKAAFRKPAELAVAHFVLGSILEAEGKVPEAVASYRKSIAFNPDFDLSHHDLALILQTQGKLPEAIAAWRSLVAIQERKVKEKSARPEDHSKLGGTLNDLAMLLNRTGEFAEARSLIDRAIERQQIALRADSDSPTYRRFLRNHHTVLTEALLGLGDHAAAARTAEKVPLFSTQGWKDEFGSAKVLALCIALALKDPKLSTEQRQRLSQDYAERSKRLLRQAVEHCPVNPQAQHTLARFLATFPHEQLRDAAQGRAVGPEGR
jgi:tetratricopeptide (TPR) repeat protein